ncbi:hypothetical protein KAH81_05250 [bacterium]|nr:hypothetical protein [bacterium]
MRTNLSKSARRAGIIVNYLALLVTIVIPEIIRRIEIPTWIAAATLSGAIFITAISYYIVYHRTGLWSFVHRSFDKYDEREAGIALNSLRIGYAIFTVIVLAIMLVYSVTEIAVNVVLVAGLIFAAHVLPASVIAWTESIIPEN